jgi:hypothetical protein
MRIVRTPFATAYPNPKSLHISTDDVFLLAHISFLTLSNPSTSVPLSHTMAASHPKMFQPSTADETEILNWSRTTFSLTARCFAGD